MNNNLSSILYFGFNHLNEYKRGVENVILAQSRATKFARNYYLHPGKTTTVYRAGDFLCVSLKQTLLWPLLLNIFVLRIKRRGRILVHSHNYLFTLFLIFRTDIFTVHDGLAYLKKAFESGNLLFFSVIERIVYRRIDYVHFVSRFAKANSLFRNECPSTIIPNTTRLENVRSSSSSAPVVFEGTKFNVLIVRSIEPRARFDLLCEVAYRLRTSDYHFVVAGRGPLLDYFREFCSVRGISNIVFLGYVSDILLTRLYANCSAVLMIAEYGEGFGLPIIESYLHNKPVIASNRCAIPEFIISPRFLFENNCHDIAAKLDYAKNCHDLDFRSYYSQRFSNLIFTSAFRDLYSLCE